MTVQCPHCRGSLETFAGLIGTTIACPLCGKDMVVPDTRAMKSTYDTKVTGPRCKHHFDRPALAACRKCHDFLCDECCATKEAQPLCKACAALPGVETAAGAPPPPTVGPDTTDAADPGEASAPSESAAPAPPKPEGPKLTRTVTETGLQVLKLEGGVTPAPQHGAFHLAPSERPLCLALACGAAAAGLAAGFFLGVLFDPWGERGIMAGALNLVLFGVWGSIGFTVPMLARNLRLLGNRNAAIGATALASAAYAAFWSGLNAALDPQATSNVLHAASLAVVVATVVGALLGAVSGLQVARNMKFGGGAAAGALPPARAVPPAMVWCVLGFAYVVAVSSALGIAFHRAGNMPIATLSAAAPSSSGVADQASPDATATPAPHQAAAPPAETASSVTGHAAAVVLRRLLMKPGNGCSGRITGADGSSLDVLLISAGASPGTGKLRLLLYDSRQPQRNKRYLGQIRTADDAAVPLRLTGLSGTGAPAADQPHPLLTLGTAPVLDLRVIGEDRLHGADEDGEYTLRLSAGIARQWTNKAGKTVAAELLGFQDGAAVFRRANGKTSINDLDMFADADAGLLRRLRELHRIVRSEEESGDASE